MPLTVPADVLDLSFSERIGGGSQSYALGSFEADAALVHAAEKARKLHRQRPVVVESLGAAVNVRMQEVRAYGLLASGQVASAREVVGEVLCHQPLYDWENEIIERAEIVQGLLETAGPASALDLVERWRAMTLEALGLDR